MSDLSTLGATAIVSFVLLYYVIRSVCAFMEDKISEYSSEIGSMQAEEQRLRLEIRFLKRFIGEFNLR